MIEGQRGAAKILDLHPNTLRSRMKKLRIERSSPVSSHEMSQPRSQTLAAVVCHSQHISNTDLARSLGGLPVRLNPAEFAGSCGQCSRLKESRGPKPPCPCARRSCSIFLYAIWALARGLQVLPNQWTQSRLSQIVPRHEQEKDMTRERAGPRLQGVRMPQARMGQTRRLGSSGRTRPRHTIRRDVA